MSGEHPNGRKAIDDLARRLIDAGVKPSDAEQKARDTARRTERDRK